MKKTLVIALACVSAVLCASVSQAAGPGVIARFAAGTSVSEVRKIVGAENAGKIEELVPGSGIFLIEPSSSKGADLLGEKMRKSASFVYAQANHPMTLRSFKTPTDPKYAQQWSLKNATKPGADIHAEEAWELGTGGKDSAGRDIVVAVIDGGIDINHQDLVENVWTNGQEIAGNGIDDDANGYVDDIHGWNVTANSGNVASARHGTHVAGIVGARGDNGKDLAGVNWNVKILAVSVGSFGSADVVKAYGYVLAQKKLWIETQGKKGANVVATNSSFGYDYADCNSADYPVWNDMYNQLGKVGILSAAATINNNTNVDQEGDVPTACSSDFIVAVTNTNREDVKYTSAGYGKTHIDLGAPGTDIQSTIPGNSVTSMTGTSMATPHVAGSIGFLYSVASNAFLELADKNPEQAALEVKRILLSTTDELPSLKEVTVSGGRLNLAKAAQAIAGFKSDVIVVEPTPVPGSDIVDALTGPGPLSSL